MKYDLKLPVKLQILLGIADALRDLHAAGVVHGDLKPANILLDSVSNPKPRLTDFGLSAIRENTQSTIGVSSLQHTSHTKGTRVYCAPEMLPNASNRSGDVSKASRKTDMYAFALLVWEVLSDKQPYLEVNNNDAALCLKVHNGDRPSMSDLSKEVPQDLHEMINLCWDTDRSIRLTAVECYSRLSHCLNVISSKSFDIFFSHKWEDKRLLSHVYAMLSAMGYRVWFDQNQMGNNLRDSMKEGIENSTVVIACVNSMYEKSGNCKYELEIAVQLKKPIITIMLEDPWKSWSMNDVVKNAIGFPNMKYCELWEVAKNDYWKPDFPEEPDQALLGKVRDQLQAIIPILNDANCKPSFSK
jgi:serine/threonine protein kinase